MTEERAQMHYDTLNKLCRLFPVPTCLPLLGFRFAAAVLPLHQVSFTLDVNSLRHVSTYAIIILFDAPSHLALVLQGNLRKISGILSMWSVGLIRTFAMSEGLLECLYCKQNRVKAVHGCL